MALGQEPPDELLGCKWGPQVGDRIQNDEVNLNRAWMAFG